MRKRWVALGLVIAVVALQGGCCLTPAMWDTQRMSARGVEKGVITADGFLWMDIGTDVTTQRVEVHLVQHGDSWWAEEQQWMPPHDPLPDGEPLVLLPKRSSLEDRPSAGWSASFWPDHRHPYVNVWWPGANDYPAVVKLEMPIDWSRPSAWAAVVATPVTALLDVLVFGPLHTAWTIGTAGGHGTPWCGFCEHGDFGS